MSVDPETRRVSTRVYRPGVADQTATHFGARQQPATETNIKAAPTSSAYQHAADVALTTVTCLLSWSLAFKRRAFLIKLSSTVLANG